MRTIPMFFGPIRSWLRRRYLGERFHLFAFQLGREGGSFFFVCGERRLGAFPFFPGKSARLASDAKERKGERLVAAASGARATARLIFPRRVLFLFRVRAKPVGRGRERERGTNAPRPFFSHFVRHRFSLAHCLYLYRSELQPLFPSDNEYVYIKTCAAVRAFGRRSLSFLPSKQISEASLLKPKRAAVSLSPEGLRERISGVQSEGAVPCRIILTATFFRRVNIAACCAPSLSLSLGECEPPM